MSLREPTIRVCCDGPICYEERWHAASSMRLDLSQCGHMLRWDAGGLVDTLSRAGWRTIGNHARHLCPECQKAETG